MRKENEIPQQGLYRESFEHDNCGIGAIVNIKGQKSHSTVAVSYTHLTLPTICSV